MIMPDIDPRVHAVGTAKLREFDAVFLRSLGEKLYIIQAGDEPLAVVGTVLISIS
jgi:hypothetical protein